MGTRPPPLESEADRLGYLEAFGTPFRTAAGTGLAVFDEPTEVVSLDDQQVNISAPQLSGSTAVFRAHGIERRGGLVEVEKDPGAWSPFKVEDVRHDRSGWTVLILGDGP